MHGRLKVKTTAQQEAERKAQREEKLKTYQGAMGAIFKNREMIRQIKLNKDKEESDDDVAEVATVVKMQLKMTAGVLLANPDISTLWNIRKELLSAFILPSTKDEQDHDKALKQELDLTVQCLQVNPKSYGAWHHRCWSMLKAKKPDWGYELGLCGKYLSMDERNFHCWDYRRFVVSHAEQVSPQDELEYSMERINVNFSNYSAWHYRSKLLPVISKNNKISEETRRQELDLVLNAAFTDPDDSSAWFYHKWLLGRPDDILKPLNMFKLSENDGGFGIAFSRALSVKQFQVVNETEEILSLTFQSASGKTHDTLWFVRDVVDCDKLLVKTENGQELHFKDGHQGLMEAEMDEDTVKVLEQELTNCNELLEIEPDSKWTMYTRLLIMKTMDSAKYLSEITDGFDKLTEIDPKRKGYYQDQKSKVLLENQITSQLAKKDLDASKMGLTKAYYKERLASFSKIDLSGNQLSSLDFLPYALNCKELVIDDNQIEGVKDVLSPKQSLPSLKTLSLKNNPITDDEEGLRVLSEKLHPVQVIV